MPPKEIDTFHILTCGYHTLTALLNKKLMLHKKKDKINCHASKIHYKIYLKRLKCPLINGSSLLHYKGKDSFIYTKKKKDAKIPLANSFFFFFKLEVIK